MEKVDRRTVLKGGAAIIAAFLSDLMPRQSPAVAAVENNWQLKWTKEETNWPSGPAGEKQVVNLGIGAGEVWALTSGHVRLFDQQGNTSSLYEATHSGGLLIPIIDGGTSGGTVRLELNNIYNWKGVAEKPVAGTSLTLKELESVILDRLQAAKQYNRATDATLIWMDTSIPDLVVAETRIRNVDMYLGRLAAHLGAGSFRVFIPRVF